MIGLVGELEESVISAFKLPEYTAAAFFDLDGASFEAENRQSNKYMPLSKYPAVEQDLTLKVADTLPFTALKSLIEAELSRTEYDWSIEPLSVYQDQKATNQEGREKTKNISFRITLTHQQRTLTTKEVTELIDSISSKAQAELKAEQV